MSGRPQCTAKSKQRGERCRNSATVGMTVCRFHGGTQKRGAESHSWKGKGYSRHAPTRLAERIEESLSDPDLMNARAEAALVTAQIGEVLSVLDVGGTLARWQEIAALVPALRGAIDEEDEKRLVAVADALDACVLGAAEERGRWGELHDLIDLKRKLVEAQAKIDQRTGLSMTDTGLLVHAFYHAIRLVKDASDRAAAMAHLERALVLPAAGEAR